MKLYFDKYWSLFSQGIYITKIAENGAAIKDGKLQVGDKVLTINGVDMEGARQDQAVSLLSGLDRFVRLVVQRKKVITLFYLNVFIKLIFFKAAIGY